MKKGVVEEVCEWLRPGGNVSVRVCIYVVKL